MSEWNEAVEAAAELIWRFPHGIMFPGEISHAIRALKRPDAPAPSLAPATGEGAHECDHGEALAPLADAVNGWLREVGRSRFQIKEVTWPAIREAINQIGYECNRLRARLPGGATPRRSEDEGARLRDGVGCSEQPTGGTTMRSEIHEAHEKDANGNPSGGTTTGRGFSIEWQNGPLAVDGVRREPNGAFVEDVISAAVGRIAHYQASKFSCRENALALTKLEEALHWLDARTKNRTARGVEGTHTA